MHFLILALCCSCCVGSSNIAILFQFSPMMTLGEKFFFTNDTLHAMASTSNKIRNCVTLECAGLLIDLNDYLSYSLRLTHMPTSLEFDDYQALHTYSVDHLGDFWRHFLDYTEIIYSGSISHNLQKATAMKDSKWFTGMSLNFAENILERKYEGTAITFSTEGGASRVDLSWETLRQSVSQVVAALRAQGIKCGDIVAGYLANVPEAIIASLACASIGAIWSSASPDFGLDAVCSRLEQVKPVLVFATSSYKHKGRKFTTDAVVSKLKSRIPSIAKIVSIGYPGEPEDELVGDVTWNQFIEPFPGTELSYSRVTPDHPLYVLFSSGTTGSPKCIVHGTLGTLIQHRKELSLHCDIKKGDSLLYYTTCGWMMWNWQLTALSLGARVCLYDGSPAFPSWTSMWQVVKDLGVTHFGTSGSFIEHCMKTPKEFKLDLPLLRTILYTGSPLSSDGFRWIYSHIKSDVHLAGISGGTDIISCFVLGNPNQPVYPGEIQCRGLGVDVVAYDDSGSVLEGTAGELVCRQPIPSMPLQFLNDPEGTKYHSAYFSVFPGIWRHGDFIKFTDRGSSVIFGRSDATLNPGGVRIGASEIYFALDTINQVVGAVAVGWKTPEEQHESIVLLVQLSDDQTKNDDYSVEPQLLSTIKKTIRSKASPRHVPSRVFSISQIPRTRSGKTIELNIKAILGGREPGNSHSFANPEILSEIQAIAKILNP